MPLFVMCIGLCWGSFLNSVAWRLLANTSLVYSRSYCPVCHHDLHWYDLIPVISWIMLHGRCRFCNTAISPLYPAIELGTGILAVTAYYMLPIAHIGWYSWYASLLIITIHTDARAHAISPLVTSYAIPINFALVYTMIPYITLIESTAIGAYGVFAGINLFYRRHKGIQAIGEGDWELVAYIASITGAHGLAYVLCGGSLLTLGCALLPTYYQDLSTDTPLPFGACLAIAGTIYPLCI